MTNLWTEQALTEMQRLWHEGFSASQIAASMKITRSAVLGKVHRSRDLFPARGVRKPRPDKIKGTGPGGRRVRDYSTHRAKKSEVRFAEPEVAAVVVALPVDARDIIVVPMSFERSINENRCLFFAADPFTDGGPSMPVCGCLRVENERRKPYCAAHLRAETQVRS